MHQSGSLTVQRHRAQALARLPSSVSTYPFYTALVELEISDGNALRCVVRHEVGIARIVGGRVGVGDGAEVEAVLRDLDGDIGHLLAPFRYTQHTPFPRIRKSRVCVYQSRNVTTETQRSCVGSVRIS